MFFSPEVDNKFAVLLNQERAASPSLETKTAPYFKTRPCEKKKSTVKRTERWWRRAKRGEENEGGTETEGRSHRKSPARIWGGSIRPLAEWHPAGGAPLITLHCLICCRRRVETFTDRGRGREEQVEEKKIRGVFGVFGQITGKIS